MKYNFIYDEDKHFEKIELIPEDKENPDTLHAYAQFLTVQSPVYPYCEDNDQGSLACDNETEYVAERLYHIQKHCFGDAKYKNIFELNVNLMQMILDDAFYDKGDDQNISEDVKTMEEASVRRKYVEAFCNRFIRQVMGRNLSFASLVEEDGRLSKKKTDEFINDLLSGVELTPEARHFYKCFFYCAILGPAARRSNYYIECTDVQYAPAEYFEDLIFASADPMFCESDRISFAKAEAQDMCNPEESGGFTFFMNEVYRDLTGKPFFKLYDTDELKAAAEEYADNRGLDPEEVLKEWKGEEPGIRRVTDLLSNIKTIVLSHEEFIVAGMEVADDDTITLDPPERSLEDIYKDFYANLCNTHRSSYLGRLPEDHHLAEQYLKLRKTFFELSPKNVNETVTNMVESYLIRNNMALLMTGSYYDTARTMLRNMVHTFEQHS